MNTLDDLDFASKRVLLRADLDVPLKNGVVQDDSRLRASLPTIRELLKKNARIIVVGHMGRPEGKTDPALSLRPLAELLSRLLRKRVPLYDLVSAKTVSKAMNPRDVIMLENIRFYPGEEKNDSWLAESLASLADVFVNDAFATAHRAHASTVGVARRLPSAAGRRLEMEVKSLGALLKSPARPFVAVLGGAKVSSKICLIENLLEKADAVLIGGAMAFTFFAAMGREVGLSLVEKDRIEAAKKMLKKGHGRIMLPIDVVVAPADKNVSRSKTVPADAVPRNMMGLDIGPQTVAAYAEIISEARTVFWNGPLGFFELKCFGKGTAAIAKAIVESGAVSVVGGGDTASAVRVLWLEKKFTHLSTGGGAALEFLEGKDLPAVTALRRRL